MQWPERCVDGPGAERAFDGRGEAVCEPDVGVFDGETAVELQGGGFGGCVD